MSSPLRLHYSAISDVGRVRKDNQDSGYAGPWLLSVCDGVGGAARGDIASSTAIQQLRELDDPPADDTGSGLLDRVTDALHEAHVRIGRLVDADPALNGTSTTATVALFDGSRIGLGHVGDSRAYLFRDGELSQLTKDHTFVQSLIDEGRITEEESRVHPHRNLILKALDGMHEAEPDLFMIELVDGDRVFLCSDGACGVLDDGRLADILNTGSPDFAAVELVRASLEAGSSDNVTCIVADVVTEEAALADPEISGLEPLLVGAAGELRRRTPRGAKGPLFRGHRSGDTGELDPIEDEIPEGVRAVPADPVDPETARYAPRPPARFQWLKRALVLAILVGVVWVGVAAAWSWTQDQYFVGEQDGSVVIYRGINTDLPGVPLSSLFMTSDVEIERLSDYDAGRVRDGIEVADLDAAQETVQSLATEMTPTDEAG
ncbi:protein phosphatase [Nocardioides psychrotolerans]|uniref:Protein phosphatase n=1 Tax=Nocardioides psychrotolerans TaxID=1005945 RepID=A0A1I3GID2_9ACTN|nr:protein phosphatase 2C domain-containing protein [Nocardioides psychrotolerans]GEP39308.1 protein phosphatase [Nocardioides psychrotolerans]SFI23248.1 protein phosphatase [Nocardioides psychrotolerans]